MKHLLNLRISRWLIIYWHIAFFLFWLVVYAMAMIYTLHRLSGRIRPDYTAEVIGGFIIYRHGKRKLIPFIKRQIRR